MIGCIISGHGSFAPGLMGAVEMVVGNQESFEVIPFLEDSSLTEYENKMVEYAERMEQETEGVIIFTDILGGTPFRMAMLAVGGRGKTEVIVGTNLPMLIECCIIRNGFSDAVELADLLVESGITSVQRVQMKEKADDVPESTGEEGI